MNYLCKTQLVNVREIDLNEWLLGYTQQEVTDLFNAADDGQYVTVLACAVDGDCPSEAYFDVRLENGTELSSIAGYHLHGIDDLLKSVLWREATNIEPEPTRPVLTPRMQFTVDIANVIHADVDVGLHDELEEMIKQAIAAALSVSKYAGQLTVDNVLYETTVN